MQLLHPFGRLARHRSMIWAMAIHQVKSRYVGSAGGLLWAVVAPLVTVLTYWFVFSVGLRVQSVGNLPFALVLFCGLVPWTLLSESLAAGMNSVAANAHLVTKTRFPSEILPVVAVVAGLITHAIMIVVLVVCLLVAGIYPTASVLLTPYYTLGLVVLSLGLGWLTGALFVFWRDIGQFVNVIIQLWFWLNPIVWDMSIVPEEYRSLLKCNPAYYVVEGYKSAFLPQVPSPTAGDALYFWAFALGTFALGGLVFRRLKPEFAEVL